MLPEWSRAPLAYLHLDWLGTLSGVLGKDHFQHAVFHHGADFRLEDGLGKDEGPNESPMRPFSAAKISSKARGNYRPLSFENEPLVLDLDFDLRNGNTREIGAQKNTLLRFVNVHGRGPDPRWQVLVGGGPPGGRRLVRS